MLDDNFCLLLSYFFFYVHPQVLFILLRSVDEPRERGNLIECEYREVIAESSPLKFC